MDCCLELPTRGDDLDMGVPPVRVVIADDHPLYRQGLVDAIEENPGLELVGQASDGDQALRLILETEPCIALLDVKMQVDGPTVLKQLQAEQVPTRVVFLSAYLDSALVYSLVGAGAAGFLSKGADRPEICDALIAAAQGGIVLSPEAQTALGHEVRLTATVDRSALTGREREVLALAAAGLSAARIGEQLYLSTATVKTHLAHLYAKLGVSDRAAAVAVAFRRGLLE